MIELAERIERKASEMGVGSVGEWFRFVIALFEGKSLDDVEDWEIEMWVGVFYE